MFFDDSLRFAKNLKVSKNRSVDDVIIVAKFGGCVDENDFSLTQSLDCKSFSPA
jgi:hypothetical protein